MCVCVVVCVVVLARVCVLMMEYCPAEWRVIKWFASCPRAYCIDIYEICVVFAARDI